MAKRNRKKKEVEEAGTMEDAPIVHEFPTSARAELEPDMEPAVQPEEADVEGLAAEADVEADNAKPNSVVAPKFKEKYLANARALGIKGKAAKRSNWDWLSQQIAACCLNDKHKIDISAFTGLLDANGVDHSRWTNRNKGWEGRFRMTGRVALQRIVADSGILHMPGGSVADAPSDWRMKYQTKE